ncbi:hypothetical protein HHI36_009363 [Cryptolaemus montrouzieri]|uniref:Peptidase S54 rhomboid domain-containing protein n=1 Tax=Cryptolaemus montrouzieri TaxID=559131 RepID=A0ABD2MVQ6_9CUCU
MRHFSLEDEKVAEDKLISPVTTPTSLIDEDKCFVRITPKSNKHDTKEICNYCVQNIPYLIVVISLTEAIFFIKSDINLRHLLRFEPNRRYQIWRYLTYMLIHEDAVHLVLNMILQCIFAFFLETKQGRIRVGIVYLVGGLTGALGASCLNPGLLIGASAGVYSLLISLVADLYLNYENTKYKVCRSLCIAVIVLSDISFNFYHYLSRDEPLISWEAHVFGGITGLFLGLALYNNFDRLQQKRKNICLTFSSLLYFLLLSSLVIITIDTEATGSVIKMKA